MNRARLALAGVVLVSGSALIAAPADVASSRVHGYRELGAAFKAINDELKSATPQVYLIQMSARQVRSTAQAQYGWFPAGSGPQPGVKTAAKPEIWSQAAQFKAAQDKFAGQANSFYQAASRGDLPAIRAQVRPLAETCGGCHRTFRTRD